tara:strand:+ start:633 stop:788 length:156 start_codon:yes stop_codon:yes gene_type:complete
MKYLQDQRRNIKKYNNLSKKRCLSTKNTKYMKKNPIKQSLFAYAKIVENAA